MQFYYIHASVPGETGKNTVFDHSVIPPRILRAHYVLDEVPYTALFTSFPMYVVSAEAKREILKANFTGVSFDEIEISKAAVYEGRSGDEDPGEFYWMKVGENVGRDDFAFSATNRLVISQRALDLLEEIGLYDAKIYPVVNIETDVPPGGPLI